MTNFTDLPKEFAEEILCRVPATDLKRARSTCKDWNGLFNNTSFAMKHFDKSPKQFLSLMLTYDFMLCPMSINLDGADPSVEVKSQLSLLDPRSNNSTQFDRVFHCDGLLLCIPRDKSRIVVWNPCTGESKWIKAGNRGVENRIIVLGYCQDNKSCGKSYKILSYKSFDTKAGSEVYDFDSDSWRTTDHDIAPGFDLAFSEICMSLKGHIYVLTQTVTEPYFCLSLLRFDFAVEKFVHVPLPCNLPSYIATSLSVVREEKLSLLLRRNDGSSFTDIWLTNTIDETKVVSWSKVLALNLSCLDFHTTLTANFLLDEEKKVLVLMYDLWDENIWENMLYIVGEDNNVTTVNFGLVPTGSCYPAILKYVPSLVHI